VDDEPVNPPAAPLPPASRPPWTGLLVAAVAFGIVEAVLVMAYRTFLDPRGSLFPLLPLPPALATWERLREAATLLLLGGTAHLACRRAASKVAAFLFLFGVWDVTYYIVLRGSLGWPRGGHDWDLLFLLPVPWIGPVYAPVVIAAVLIAVGTFVLQHEARRGVFRVHALHGVAAGVGGLLCVWSFVEDDAARALVALPSRYAVEFLVLGLAIGVGAFVDAVRRNRRARGATG